MNITEKRIIRITKKLFECDTARISNYDKKFLIIKNPRKNNYNHDYNYYISKDCEYGKINHYKEEYCIASGKTYLELFKDMRKYLNLTKISMEEDLLSLKIYQ